LKATKGYKMLKRGTGVRRQEAVKKGSPSDVSARSAITEDSAVKRTQTSTPTQNPKQSPRAKLQKLWELGFRNSFRI
jgi:hypothetical protein